VAPAAPPVMAPPERVEPKTIPPPARVEAKTIAPPERVEAKQIEPPRAEPSAPPAPSDRPAKSAAELLQERIAELLRNRNR